MLNQVNKLKSRINKKCNKPIPYAYGQPIRVRDAHIGIRVWDSPKYAYGTEQLGTDLAGYCVSSSSGD